LEEGGGGALLPRGGGGEGRQEGGEGLGREGLGREAAEQVGHRGTPCELQSPHAVSEGLSVILGLAMDAG
jgi:hypothetical protein